MQGLRDQHPENTRITTLKMRGASDRDAEVLIKASLDPYARCAICGVPVRMLALYHRHRIPVPSTRGKRWRLEIDRIQPGGPYTPANSRLLCPSCNALRGAAVKTDGEVLARMRKNWQRTFAVAHLWWLNTIPGAGGTPFRGSKHQREDEDEIPVRS